MKSLILATSFIAAVAAHGSAHGRGYLQPPIQTNVSVFNPPEDYTIPKVLYGRLRALQCSKDDVILAAWENYLPTESTGEGCPPNCPENPYIPIYQSFDQGQTWSERAQVHDTQNGWGLRYQPELHELTEPIGEYEPGTLVLAANSIPSDLNGTKIDIYVSRDEGHTWEFASNVAEGGYAIPENQYDPIWEPFIVTYKGQLIVYYADQREDEPGQTNLGQKLSHQVTSNLHEWGPVVEDVRYENPEQRPGMPVITELSDGNWLYTFELLSFEEEGFDLYYRIASTPLDVADAEDVQLVPNTNTRTRGTPYNVWTPAGGPNGTIVAGDNYHTSVYINKRLGDPSAWEEIETPAGLAYSRSFLVLPNDPSRIMIISPGPNPGVGDNEVLVTTIDLDDKSRPYPHPYTGHQITRGKCAPRGRNPGHGWPVKGNGKGKGKGHDGHD